MKKIMIPVSIVALIAITAWCVHAETAVDNGVKAASSPAADAQPAASSAEGSPDTAKVTFEKFECPEGKFSVSIPAGWSHTESFPYGIDDTVNGVMLEGPKNGDGAVVKIAVLHYAGTGSIKGGDHYIEKVLFSPTRLDAEEETKFSEVEIAGKKGKTFTFTRFELIKLPWTPPPMKDGIVYELNPPTKKVTMIDR